MSRRDPSAQRGLRTGDRPSSDGVCSRCLQILPDRIFSSGRSRRQKRYLIGNPRQQSVRSSCIVCTFLQQVDDLALEATDMPSGSRRGGMMGNIATGQTEAALSTYDTQTPWWHVLGLQTPRVLPDYCWYENSPKSHTSKLPKARIAITWLQNDDAAAASSVPHKRSTQGAEHGKLDLTVVAEWLKACDTEHQAACHFDKGGRTPIDIRLINLTTREIENADTDFRYAALSYVWGSQVKTRHGQEAGDSQSSRELSPLAQVSQTRRLPKQLPATLEDAITIASELGEQYLWLDLFCIDQTVEHELESQVRQMNIIYQSATFTIIARDGEDAHAGIAGISRPMKLRAQPTCELSNGTLMATALRPVAGNAGKSPWDKRAWTMQEFLFSYRSLIFSDHQVRMIKRTRRALVRLADKNAWDNVYSIDLRAPEWSLRNFNNLLSVYTSRLLKYPSDILSACKGALAELEARTGQKFNDYGIPLNDAHRALLWSPHHHHTLTRRRPLHFPSWSWCGWLGRIEYRQWLIDLPDLAKTISTTDLSSLAIINEKAKRRKTTNGTTKTTLPTNVAQLTFRRRGVLHIASRAAFCTLQKRRRDKDSHPTGSFSSATPTLLTTAAANPGVGTLVKSDVGYLWTIVSSSPPHRPMIDVANNAEEPHVFDETNYFLRLSREDSHELLEQRGAGQQNRQRGQVLLVQVHDLPLVRDSEVHNWWLADMVSCLVLVQINCDGNNSATTASTSIWKGDDGLTKWKRLGALLLEKEVFEGFKPVKREVDVV
ncbi:hypothetical protein DV736_g5317, partial [Chaetothyriales sp. CBS 134916]